MSCPPGLPLAGPSQKPEGRDLGDALVSLPGTEGQSRDLTAKGKPAQCGKGNQGFLIPLGLCPLDETYRGLSQKVGRGWGRVTDATHRPPVLQEEAPSAGQAHVARCPQGPFTPQSVAPTCPKLIRVSGPLSPKPLPRLPPVPGLLFSCPARPLLQAGYLHPDWTPPPGGSLSTAPTIQEPD